MSARLSRPRAYKETTLQQLRSFYETARLGSLAAAADALGLSHPTVWEQVHALERDLGESLIEPHGRGCRVTDAGRLLADLAAPVVLGAAGLKQRFHEGRAGVRPALTVVTTPRILTDDLPVCVREFGRRRPDADLTLRELGEEEAFAQIKHGLADVAVLSPVQSERGQSETGQWLEQELAYELDFVLVTPKDHPLARRRTVRPEDLVGYPLVNGPSGFTDSDVLTRLETLGLFRCHPCRIEAHFTASTKRYVELGFGIGIITRLPSQSPAPHLHERAMSQYFGRVPVYLMRRRGEPDRDVVTEFRDVVRKLLRPAEEPRTPRRRKAAR